MLIHTALAMFIDIALSVNVVMKGGRRVTTPDWIQLDLHENADTLVLTGLACTYTTMQTKSSVCLAVQLSGERKKDLRQTKSFICITLTSHPTIPHTCLCIYLSVYPPLSFCLVLALCPSISAYLFAYVWRPWNEILHRHLYPSPPVLVSMQLPVYEKQMDPH